MPKRQRNETKEANGKTCRRKKDTSHRQNESTITTKNREERKANRSVHKDKSSEDNRNYDKPSSVTSQRTIGKLKPTLKQRWYHRPNATIMAQTTRAEMMNR